jgi:hypothetical protein
MKHPAFEHAAKRIAKKIYKTGLFHSIDIDAENCAVTYKDAHMKAYCFQWLQGFEFGVFRIGIVHRWTASMPTFESEYNSIGDVERAYFEAIHQEQTDNPDYVLRTSKQFILN